MAFRSGDLVRVRRQDEIRATLDENGAMDGLPFMPEMLQYCGRSYRVYHRAVQCVIDAASLSEHRESFVRRFENDDVVLLDGLRCSGVHHDGCQRGCSIFWKEAWLELAEPHESDHRSMSEAQYPEISEFSRSLKTRDDQGRYLCQSSEFLKATRHLTAGARVWNCFKSVAVGNFSAWEMMGQILTWTFWKARERVFGIYPRGSLTKTPNESLNLQPGELVEVKSLREILATLDRRGRNRGLHFSADQRVFCGGRYRVRGRADKIIAEGTGEMRGLKDTVLIENVLCDSAYYSFGGCSRRELQYWREIWLRRVDADSTSGSSGEPVHVTKIGRSSR